jgi:predicted transcriptional regulator
MDTPKRNYGTVGVHLANDVISKIDEIATREDRSRSRVLARIIRQELAKAPEPQIRFARRRAKSAA